MAGGSVWCDECKAFHSYGCRVDAELAAARETILQLTRTSAEAIETAARRGRLLRVAAGALELVDDVLPDRPNAEFIRRVAAELAE